MGSQYWSCHWETLQGPECCLVLQLQAIAYLYGSFSCEYIRLKDEKFLSDILKIAFGHYYYCCDFFLKKSCGADDRRDSRPV